MTPRSASTWLALDVLFLGSRSIRPLGRKFKAGGPCSVVCLLCAAKVQDDDGRAVMSWSALVDGAYLSSTKTARAIVSECVDVGLLELLEDDGTDFHVRFVRWNEWQRKDRTAAARAKAYRERQKDESSRSVTDDDDVTSRVRVTDTEQYITEQDSKRPSGGMGWLRDASVHLDLDDDSGFGEAA